jgi:transposase
MAGPNILSIWTDILDLPGFVVASMDEDVPHNRYHFTVIPQHAIGICPHCGKPSDAVKQCRNRDGILDLPIGSRAVELTIRVKQFECEKCGQCFTPPIDFLAESSHATERLLERAAELIRHSDVANVAQFYGVPERTLERWYYDYVERRQEQEAKTSQGPIRRIGIDELSLKKSTDSSSP